MILQIVITLLIIYIIYLVRQWYFKPKRILEIYAQTFRSQGYKVFVYPYNPFLIHYDRLFVKNGKLNGDVYKTIREDYPGYDIVLANVSKYPLIQIMNPEIIKKFFDGDKHFSFPKIPFINTVLTRIIGEGIVVAEGQKWEKKRQILNKLFNFQFLKQKIGAITQISDLCIQDFERDIPVQIDKETGEKYIQMDILSLFIQSTSEVIFKLFLGMKTSEKIQGKSIATFLVQLIDEISLACLQFQVLLFGLKFFDLGLKQSHRRIERRRNLYKKWALNEITTKIASVQQQLSKNKQKKIPSDIIQAVIMDKAKNQPVLQVEQLLSELSTFLFAGTDSTSHFIEMMVYYIAKDPEIQRRLRAEIDKFMSKDDYSFQNLKNMIYIDWIQNETIRLYGPAPHLFYRQAKEDNTLAQIPIRKQTIVSIFNQVNHLSQQYFVEPNKFRPQRWEKQCQNLPSYAYFGFSAGARACLGKQLALLQSKIILIKFFKRYKKIILPNNKEIKLKMKFLPEPEKFQTKLVLND